MDLKLKGKVVAITGGSSGIGRGASLAFAKEGCKVAVCSRSEEKLKAIKAELEELGCETYIQQVNVSNVSEIQLFVDNVAAKFGHIDIWVNNAGANHPKPVLEHTVEDWNYLFELNARSVYFGCQFAMRHMIENDVKGVILNMSSYTALGAPVAEHSLYSATKAAINSFTKSLEAECAPYGIRVVAIAPGIIVTDMADGALAGLDEEALLDAVAERRFGTTEEVGNLMAILCSEVSGYIAGIAVEVSGGKLCVQNPGLMWKKKQGLV